MQLISSARRADALAALLLCLSVVLCSCPATVQGREVKEQFTLTPETPRGFFGVLNVTATARKTLITVYDGDDVRPKPEPEPEPQPEPRRGPRFDHPLGYGVDPSRENYYPVDLEKENPYLGLDHLTVTVAHPHDGRYFAHWLDCGTRTANFFYYSLATKQRHEFDKLSRPGFHVSPKYSRNCSQPTSRGYGSDTGCYAKYRQQSDVCFDKGHMVPNAHMKFNREAQHSTFNMLNIAPQQANFNENNGAWYETEQQTEDLWPQPAIRLMVLGGIIYGKNITDEMVYLPRHQIYTARWWWKVLIVHRGGSGSNGKDSYSSAQLRPHEATAWLMPNNKTSVWDPNDKGVKSLEVYQKSLPELREFIRSNSNYTDFDFNYKGLYL